ncbi:MAG: glycosyltransferase family 2 protein [Candidatus Bathyarchaeia archaeon]
MNKGYNATVVVLNRNGEKIIDKCLSSIMNQSIKNIEVIVVDNASTDNSIKVINSFFIDKLIINDRNLGFTGGCWIGIKNANSEYVAFINNDAILNVDWMERMLISIKKDSKIGAIGGKVLKPDGKIDSIGAHIKYPSGRSGFSRDYESGNIEDVASLPGSAFMVRKSIALKIGFLDPDYFVLYDETDFFWRLRLAGYRCVYDPQTISWHFHAYTFDRDSYWTYFRREYFYLRNMMWSNLKNLDRRHIVPYVIFEICFAIKQALKLLLFVNKNKTVKEYVKAYYLAMITTLLSVRKLILKRRFVQSIRKVPDDCVLKYHIKDENAFSKLILRLTGLK